MPRLSEDFMREYLENLRIPQIRVLIALKGTDENGIVKALSRIKICEECGFTLTSGTVTRVMRGLPGGTSSGPAFLGLLELGLVNVVLIDVDGITEQCYQITLLGRRVIECYSENLPAMRSREASTNDRYRKILREMDSGQSDIYGRIVEEVCTIWDQ